MAVTTACVCLSPNRGTASGTVCIFFAPRYMGELDIDISLSDITASFSIILATSSVVEIGFLMRGEIIWDKGSSVGSSTAWGSWLSASNPTLRDVHEYILVFSKGQFKRQQNGKVSTIKRDDFLKLTKSVWQFPTESASRVGHPAPFPVELPRRLIELYTFKGDLILDPFMGSGTTALAALETGRHYIGYELDQKYAHLAQNRIQKRFQNGR